MLYVYKKLIVFWYTKEEYIQLVHKVSITPSCECGDIDNYIQSFPYS